MTAMLARLFDDAGVDYSDPSGLEQFFNRLDQTKIRNRVNTVESPPKSNPAASCNTNLFFGFFHDGTRNNYGESLKTKDHAHTNVARLYSCFPGRSVPGVVAGEPEWKHQPDQFKHYFRVYTPGVGSAFDLVGDSGKGKDRTLGGAAGYKGEPRIIWTLLQAINNLHRYFHNDAPLVTASEANKLYGSIRLNRLTLQSMADTPPPHYADAAERAAFATRETFASLLRRLHGAIQYNMRDADGSKPRNTNPAIVQQIYVSVFGFSRGAAAARAFANWLVALCKLDAQLLGRSGCTLGGFPVNFDFLGLFDTVASVGLANTFNTADGHWEWADAEVSLRVPHEFSQCLHLVAGHEVRRSFPLDSISDNGALGSGRAEIVYPGVHSDVGGGYRPKEHGKGKDTTGRDMLSRLPLAHMYRAARLAGVPLKLELVMQESVKDDFRIAPDTIAAFNRYLSHASATTGPLTGIMREQCKFHILWRKKRRQAGPAPLEGIASYQAAPQVEKNDLHCANEEFTQEITEFEHWRDNECNRTNTATDSLRSTDDPCGPEELSPRAPGFRNDYREEWKEIARFWDKETLPEGMEAFFDDYVHDSRAAFKLTGLEADEVEAELKRLVLLRQEYEEARDDDHRQDPLTPDERKAVAEYLKTGRIPEMKSDGREPARIGRAGYLRYRKVYAGGDAILISNESRSMRDRRMAASRSLRFAKAA